MTNYKHIELDQGVDHLGRVFGYDHKRKNFITWGLDKEAIVVVKIENDDDEDDHGEESDTRKDAESVAAIESAKANSRLVRAIQLGFQRP
jgi:hypothetical protein